MSQYVLAAFEEARSKVRQAFRSKLETLSESAVDRLTKQRDALKSPRGWSIDPAAKMQELSEVLAALLVQAEQLVDEHAREMKEIELWENSVKAGDRIAESARQ